MDYRKWKKIAMTLDQFNKVNFYIFVLLLPFCALGYFFNIFSSWAANASLYPLLTGLMIVSIYIFAKKKLFIDQSLKYLIIFSFTVLIGTFIMSIILSNFVHITSGSPEDILIGALRKIFTIPIIFLVVYYTSISSKNYGYRFVLKALYTSYILVLIYGYIQLLAILIPFSSWYNIYMIIQERINFGWIGLNENFNQIPQIYKYGGRVILTTQEPSVAGYLLTSLYYPFFLSSLITNYSVYRIKFFGKPLEFMFFTLSIPLVFFTFSTSLYVVFLLLILTASYLYYRKLSIKKLIKLMLLSVMLFFTLIYIYNSLPQYHIETITQTLNKLFMSGQGEESAQTRYGFIYAGFMEFLHYPIFGVGLSNSQYVFAKYIPDWAINSEVVYYLSTGKALGPKGFWALLLGETGIVGTLLFLLFLYSILMKYLKIKYESQNKELFFLKYAFFIFLISFLIQGFNSAALFFIWQWAVFGFFIGFYYNIKG